MDVDNISVKLNLDIKSYLTGLKKASAEAKKTASDIEKLSTTINLKVTADQTQLNALRKTFSDLRQEAERGATFKLNVDASGAQDVRQVMQDLRSDANNGATFKLTADTSGTQGVKSVLSDLRADASNGATFALKADASGTNGIKTTLTDLRSDANNGATFKIITDLSGIAGASSELQSLRSDASNGATMDIDADTSGIAGAAGEVQSLKSIVASADDTINIKADLDDTPAIETLDKFKSTATETTTSVASAFQTLTSRIIASFALMAPAAAIAASSLNPLLGAAAGFAGIGASVAGGIGLITGAFHYMKKGLEEGDVAFANLQQKLDDFQAASAEAFRPASLAMADLSIDVLDFAQSKLPLIGTAATETMGVFSEAVRGALDTLNQPMESSSLVTVLDSIPEVIGNLTSAGGDVLAGVLNILATAAPYGERLSRAIADAAEAFLGWSESEDARTRVQQWLDQAADVLSTVWDSVKKIGGALEDLSTEHPDELNKSLLLVRDTILLIVSAVGLAADAFEGLDKITAAENDWTTNVRSQLGLESKGEETLGNNISKAMEDLQAGGGETGFDQLLGGLETGWEAVTSWFSGLGSEISGLLEIAWETVKSSASGLGTILSEAFSSAQESVSGAVSGLVDGIVSYFSDLPTNLGTTLGTIAGTLAGTLVNAGSAVGSAASSLVSTIVGFFTALPGNIASALATVGEVVGGAILMGASAVGSAASSLVSTIVGFFSNLPENIGSILSTVGSTISGWVSSVGQFFVNLPSTIMSALSSLGSTISSIFTTGFSEAGETTSTMVTDVVGYIASLPGKVVSALSSFVSSFTQSFRDAYNEVVGQSIVPDMVNEIVEWIGSIPSKILGLLGDAATWLITPFQTAWDALTEWMAGLVPDINLLDVLMGAVETGGDIATSILTTLQGAWTSVTEWLAGLVPEISLWDVLMGAAESGGDLVSGILETLGGVWTGITEWLAGLVPEISLWDVIMGAVESGGDIVTSVLTTLGEVWTGITEWLGGLVPEINLFDVIMGAVESGGDLAAGILETLAGVWSSITEWMAGLVPDIPLMDIILGVAGGEDPSKLVDAALVVLNQLWDEVKRIWEDIKTTVTDAMTAIGEAVSSGWTTVTTTITDGLTSLYETWTGYFGAEGTLVTAVSEFLSSLVETYWTPYFGADGTLITAVSDFFTSLIDTYWTPYFGADGTLITAISDFFTSLIDTYWTPYFGTDGTLLTAISDFFTYLIDTYWTPYFGTDGTLLTAISDFFTYLIDTYWTPYFGSDGTLITAISDFFTSLIDTYWTPYFGSDGTLLTAISDFFTYLVDTYWTPYFGGDGSLLTAISDFFTYLVDTYWTPYFGTDGSLITTISDFFTSLYDDYFLYYLGSDGTVVTAVADAWTAILDGVGSFVKEFGDTLAHGISDAVNAAIGFMQSLLNAIDLILGAIGLSELGVTLPTVSVSDGGFSVAAEGGVVGMAGGGARGGQGTHGNNPQHIVWNEQQGREWWIATSGPKRQNESYLAGAANDMGYGIVPMARGGRAGQDVVRGKSNGIADRQKGKYRNKWGKGARFRGAKASGPMNHVGTGPFEGGENAKGTYSSSNYGAISLPMAGGGVIDWSAPPEIPWSEAAQSMVDDVLSNFSASANSYLGHGEQGGSTEDQTADFWGGAQGSPIDPSVGDAIKDYVLANYDVGYMIWNGQYYNDSEAPFDFPEDPHYDHVHVSLTGGWGGGGGIINSMFNKAKEIWDSFMSDLGTVDMGDGPFWDGVEGYINDLPGKAWDWAKSKIPTPSSILTGVMGMTGNIDNINVGEKLAEGAGWVGDQWEALKELWMRESGWDTSATNPDSGAYGIPQSLGHGDIGDTPVEQIEWGIDYITERYGDPVSALEAWYDQGWYEEGGVIGMAKGGNRGGGGGGGGRNNNRGGGGGGRNNNRGGNRGGGGGGGGGAKGKAGGQKANTAKGKAQTAKARQQAKKQQENRRKAKQGPQHRSKKRDHDKKRKHDKKRRDDAKKNKKKNRLSAEETKACKNCGTSTSTSSSDSPTSTSTSTSSKTKPSKSSSSSSTKTKPSKSSASKNPASTSSSTLPGKRTQIQRNTTERGGTQHQDIDMLNNSTNFAKGGKVSSRPLSTNKTYTGSGQWSDAQTTGANTKASTSPSGSGSSKPSSSSSNSKPLSSSVSSEGQSDSSGDTSISSSGKGKSKRSERENKKACRHCDRAKNRAERRERKEKKEEVKEEVKALEEEIKEEEAAAEEAGGGGADTATTPTLTGGNIQRAALIEAVQREMEQRGRVTPNMGFAAGGVVPRYHRGGVIPGRGEKGFIAEAGERVLPTRLNKGFERLAHAIAKWNNPRRRMDDHPVDNDGVVGNGEVKKKLEELLEEIKRGHKEPTPVNVHNTDDLRVASITGSFAVLESKQGKSIIDQGLAEAIRFRRGLTGK